MEAFQSWIFWLLRSSWSFEELWSSRHQHSKHNDTPSWQFYTCLDWLLSHFILSFWLFFHPLQSLVSSLCPVRQLVILTCLYWSHLPLAYWVFLSDQQIASFFRFPLSLLSSLFPLLSIFSICYLNVCKHQGLWLGNDSAGSRGQTAACKASTGSTNCTCQPIINVATKRGRVTMQSNRTQIHVSDSAHYQEGFQEWQVFNPVTLLQADANSRNWSCDTS